MNGIALKLAFIGARGIGNSYGGIETYYEEVGSRLAQRGHQVTVYCRNYFTPAVNDYRGMRVRRLPSVPSKHLDTFVHSFLSTLDVLWRDVDIVQYHALGPSLFSFLPRIVGHKSIASVRGLDWQREKWGRFATRALKVGEFASARFPTITVVVSKTLRQYYASKYGKTPVYIPNGVLTAGYREAAKINAYGLRKDNFLLFAGRLSPEKGCHYLLEALRPLRSGLKLAFAGGSSYSEGYIRQLRDAAWDDVLFLGYVDRDTMAELYSNCYAFVLPSEMEGLSNSLLEALSYGNCIIASDIEENLEVIEDAGLSFRSADVSSLQDALKHIIENPAVVKAYREKALERSRSQFDWDEITRQTESLYYRLLQPQQMDPSWKISGESDARSVAGR